MTVSCMIPVDIVNAVRSTHFKQSVLINCILINCTDYVVTISPSARLLEAASFLTAGFSYAHQCTLMASVNDDVHLIGTSHTTLYIDLVKSFKCLITSSKRM